VVGYIKGKSAIHVARHFLKRERNYAGQRIWARGFFVDMVGRDTETIRKYIAEQEREDRRLDQLEMPEITRE
jgi:putative transposase